MSGLWKTLFKTLQVKISPSTAYHPQTDGQTEIVNRKLEEMIRFFVNYDKDNWDDHLVEFEFAYNASVHSTTAHAPFFLNHGLNHKTLLAELMVPQKHSSIQEFLSNIARSSKEAHANIAKGNEQMARYANKKRKDHKLKVRDRALLSTKNLKVDSGSRTRKLHPKYCGPFTIPKQISSATFKLMS